mmetsp:Transcript_9701/g.12111  ORF Transcript_9701/g.12111 Transcript_9701/m.12111 type:complete len:114 (-) Transcript_9701:960-1301(-)|eukprot:CAMPEP_0204831814 /NCGR_PEP_ID=MMETSP1346-20131115/11799_1 /ASSEMBLY_ACC=CAM_ASM_000771 /TAXON_ID=215587 /ORGANISM="Aplanochytrium stocchinoi, Strain GSBS06" /LENGTH=113 /DNA_ID=CAMNT_0051963185 /DNA_START=70 /DNA_END=411 /DNA_ORIENTATION=+
MNKRVDVVTILQRYLADDGVSKEPYLDVGVILLAFGVSLLVFGILYHVCINKISQKDYQDGSDQENKELVFDAPEFRENFTDDDIDIGMDDMDMEELKMMQPKISNSKQLNID